LVASEVLNTKTYKMSFDKEGLNVSTTKPIKGGERVTVGSWGNMDGNEAWGYCPPNVGNQF